MPQTPPPADLSQRRQAQTRREIEAAAIALFAERGFDDATMDDVAVAAGVSRRTAYRHFPNKEDLVFEQPRRWLERFMSVTRERLPGESLRTLIRRALIEVAELIESEQAQVLAAYSVLMKTPSLRGRHGKSDSDWRDYLFALLAPEVDTGEPAMLQAAVTAGTLIGTTNAIIATWALQQPNGDLPVMTVLALDQIDSVWPASTR